MRCRFSHLKNTCAPLRSSAVRERSTGVRWATPCRPLGSGGRCRRSDRESGVMSCRLLSDAGPGSRRCGRSARACRGAPAARGRAAGSACVSWITRASSSSSALHGSASVKRMPCGPRASKTRVSPPFTLWRATRITTTRSTPSRCAPSGVGRPMPSVRCRCETGAPRRTSGCAPRKALARPRQAAQQRGPGGVGDQRGGRSARTSARCRRAARCIRPAASARGAAPAAPAPPSTTKQPWRRAGSGRRRAGAHRAADRPQKAASATAPAGTPARRPATRRRARQNRRAVGTGRSQRSQGGRRAHGRAWGQRPTSHYWGKHSSRCQPTGAGVKVSSDKAARR